jgi:hypothetical protein
MPERITLTAAGDLRDALAAIQRGDTPAAAYGLAAIDPGSWAAIEARLKTLGGSLPELLAALGGEAR